MAGVGARTRAVAAEIVDAVAGGGQSLDTAIADKETRVPDDERPLLRLLCYGTLRNHWQLQACISELLDRPLKRRDRVINALLAVGLLQLTDTRVPDHAAVSLTVEAARQLRRPKLAGVVNACLRRFQRDDIVAPASDETRWNHPQWLIDRIRRDWPDDWQNVLECNNERAPMWLRVNTSRVPLHGYRSKLQQADVDSEPLDGVPEALRLSRPQRVDELPGFRAGDVSVQDAAAQIAGGWLMAKTRGRILDACAAPGGKSGHMLELGGTDIELTALDSDAGRLDRLRENLDRIGRNATIIAGDASNPGEWWDGDAFDGILVDAPCSATGVIRRHPDIKLLRRAADVGPLVEGQRAILEAAWAMLRPGGHLLYATCSTLAAENDDVIVDFLRIHGDAREDDVLPNNNIRDLMRRKDCGYQVLPGTAGLDGFYYACLQKKVS